MGEKTALTGDDLLRMSEQLAGTELVEGELVKMAPTGFEHGDVEGAGIELLRRWNRQHKLGKVSGGEVGFYTRHDDRTVRAADIVFMSHARLKAFETSGYGTVAPELVVEVMSPHDSASEIEEKAHEWLKFGVLLVWVIYPKTQRIHVFAPDRDVRVLEADATLEGGEVLPGFSVQVRAFFED
jgi:Uma2 family endonuclease